MNLFSRTNQLHNDCGCFSARALSRAWTPQQIDSTAEYGREGMAETACASDSEVGHTNRNYSDLVNRVRANDSAAIAELYQLVQHGVRFLIVRRVEYSEIDDVLHDVFVAAMQAIHGQTIESPGFLLAYLRGIARKKVSWMIETRNRYRPSPAEEDEFATAELSPEEQVNRRQEAALMERFLAATPVSDREVLVRFYLKGETATSICESMGLTATQFRLLKWRAKARFVSKCERLLANHVCLRLRAKS